MLAANQAKSHKILIHAAISFEHCSSTMPIAKSWLWVHGRWVLRRSWYICEQPVVLIHDHCKCVNTIVGRYLNIKHNSEDLAISAISIQIPYPIISFNFSALFMSTNTRSGKINTLKSVSEHILEYSHLVRYALDILFPRPTHGKPVKKYLHID